jgi:hypothetical protein
MALAQAGSIAWFRDLGGADATGEKPHKMVSPPKPRRRAINELRLTGFTIGAATSLPVQTQHNLGATRTDR